MSYTVVYTYTSVYVLINAPFTIYINIFSMPDAFGKITEVSILVKGRKLRRNKRRSKRVSHSSKQVEPQHH